MNRPFGLQEIQPRFSRDTMAGSGDMNIVVPGFCFDRTDRTGTNRTGEGKGGGGQWT